ncbi:delta-1-pyrroline-5-carboxylate dehydrogenase, mitochondrial isoform X2 [Spodoptera frugiperda]|uniref:Delta-1-pyrroline-5-carboxylate dehydrogenase, mitochondrial isoform X2 n=1 Tax=Spodoptera frugiperda TaxID=7108 RepID=A0A9R0EF57_SPOFR|nr:delta-1-pyrroline-5-carboxylate dehydrogenase, mitochondrial isoform X2 [Spodoptera frugiperda]
MILTRRRSMLRSASVELRVACRPRGMSRAARSARPASALQPQCAVYPRAPRNERVLEHCVGTKERECLAHELTMLTRNPDTIPIVLSPDTPSYGDCCSQMMPFDHQLVAAYFHRASPATITQAIELATACQPSWERTSVDERCGVLERATDLLAGVFRQRVIAAAMIGQGMTAIQAELNVCQLIDYLRFGCYFMRELTRNKSLIDGGDDAINHNQYHGLEGFWAAITPYNSLAYAAQLAIMPTIIGNCVVWKPSDHSVLACYRVFECLQCAGLPPGVINFVPADEKCFLEAVCSNTDLAGISFGGTTRTLEHIWRTVGAHIDKYLRFPRIVGTGSGKNFHVVHSSANLANAVACTARAAFEMAGQKSSSCSRVFVAQSVLDRFTQCLAQVAQSLVVCHPLDYRCFMSALASQDAYDKVYGFLERACRDSAVRLVCGGRTDRGVGYFVEPTVYVVPEPTHELMCEELRGPVLAVCGFPDDDREALVWAVAQTQYAITGSIFARDTRWAQWAAGALREYSAALYLNARCSEDTPGQQAVGGTRKSAAGGGKAGSMSYLLQFATERSIREALHACTDVTYSYMDETPPVVVLK